MKAKYRAGKYARQTEEEMSVLRASGDGVKPPFAVADIVLLRVVEVHKRSGTSLLL